MRFFPSRKAQTELSLQQIIGLIIAVVIVLATVGLFISLMMIFSGPPDSGSVRTLDLLHKTVLAFDNPRNLNESCYIRAEYVSEDWSIVGFNADDVRAADNDFKCKLGGNCIEESCGHDDDVIKPGACGKGPCLCLCNGGGDVDGNDCQETGATCRKVAVNAGFDQFYYPISADEDGEYGLQLITGDPECRVWVTLPNGRRSGLCDMVIRSESCWLQNNHNVRYTLVVMKFPLAGREKFQLIIDMIPTSDLERVYPAVTTDCKIMIENLENFRAEEPVEEVTEESSPGVLPGALTAAGAGRGTPTAADAGRPPITEP
ncbi:hypothetical protein JW898_01220 [Candidatus Woesearchaeota archaeon]|nr:hypothetical protein [Candidatus Woesearchaeota archaeon]